MREDAFQVYLRNRNDLLKTVLISDDITEELEDYRNALTNLNHQNIQIQKTWVDGTALSILKNSYPWREVEQDAKTRGGSGESILEPEYVKSKVTGKRLLIGHKDKMTGQFYPVDEKIQNQFLNSGEVDNKDAFKTLDRESVENPYSSKLPFNLGSKIYFKNGKKQTKAFNIHNNKNRMAGADTPNYIPDMVRKPKMAHEMMGFPTVTNPEESHFYKKGIHPLNKTHPKTGKKMLLHRNIHYVDKDFSNPESLSNAEKDGNADIVHEETHKNDYVIKGTQNTNKEISNTFLGPNHSVNSTTSQYHHFYERNYLKWKTDKHDKEVTLRDENGDLKSYKFNDVMDDENKLRNAHFYEALEKWDGSHEESSVSEKITNLEHTMRQTGKSEKEVIDDMKKEISLRGLSSKEAQGEEQNGLEELRKGFKNIEHSHELGFIDDLFGLAWLSPKERTKVKQHIIKHGFSDSSKNIIKLDDNHKITLGYVKREIQKRIKHEQSLAMRGPRDSPPNVHSGLERGDNDSHEHGTINQVLDEIQMPDNKDGYEGTVENYLKFKMSDMIFHHDALTRPDNVDEESWENRMAKRHEFQDINEIMNLSESNLYEMKKLTNHFKKMLNKDGSRVHASPMFEAYQHMLDEHAGVDEDGNINHFKDSDIPTNDERKKIENRNRSHMTFKDFLNFIHMEEDSTADHGFRMKHGNLKHGLFNKKVFQTKDEKNKLIPSLFTGEQVKKLKKEFDNKLGLNRSQKENRRHLSPYQRINPVSPEGLSKKELKSWVKNEKGELLPMGHSLGEGFEIGGYSMSAEHFIDYLHSHTIHKVDEDGTTHSLLGKTVPIELGLDENGKKITASSFEPNPEAIGAFGTIFPSNLKAGAKNGSMVDIYSNLDGSRGKRDNTKNKYKNRARNFKQIHASNFSTRFAGTHMDINAHNLKTENKIGQEVLDNVNGRFSNSFSIDGSQDVGANPGFINQSSKQLQRDAISHGATFRPYRDKNGTMILEPSQDNDENIPVELKEFMDPTSYNYDDKVNKKTFDYEIFENNNPVKNRGNLSDIGAEVEKLLIEYQSVFDVKNSEEYDSFSNEKKRRIEQQITDMKLSIKSLKDVESRSISETNIDEGRGLRQDLERHQFNEKVDKKDAKAISEYSKILHAKIMAEYEKDPSKFPQKPFDVDNPTQFYIDWGALMKHATHCLAVDESDHGLKSLGFGVVEEEGRQSSTGFGSKRDAENIPEHKSIRDLMMEENFGVTLTSQDSIDDILKKLKMPSTKETEKLAGSILHELNTKGEAKYASLGQMLGVGFHPARKEINGEWIGDSLNGGDEHRLTAYDDIWNELETPLNNSNASKKVKSAFAQDRHVQDTGTDFDDYVAPDRKENLSSAEMRAHKDNFLQEWRKRPTNFGSIKEIGRRMENTYEEEKNNFGLNLHPHDDITKPSRGHKDHSNTKWRKYNHNMLLSVISADPSVKPKTEVNLAPTYGVNPTETSLTPLTNPSGNNVVQSRTGRLRHEAGLIGTPSYNLKPQPDGEHHIGPYADESSFVPPSDGENIFGSDIYTSLLQNANNIEGDSLPVQGYAQGLENSNAQGDYTVVKGEKLPKEMPLIEPLHKIFEIKDLEQLRGFTGEWVASYLNEGERIKIIKAGNNVKAYNTDNVIFGLSTSILSSLRKLSKKNYTIDAIYNDEGVFVNDVMHYDGTDVTDLNTRERMKLLRGQFDSHEDVHVLSPSTLKITDEDGLENAVKDLLQDNKEGKILLRDAKSSYMKGEEKHPKWVLMTKSEDDYHIPFGMEIEDNHFILHFADDIVKYDILDDEVTNPQSMLAELSGSQYPIILAKSLENYWKPAFYQMWKAEKEKKELIPQKLLEAEQMEEESVGIIDADDESQIMKPKNAKMLKTLELIERALDVLEKANSNMAGRGLGIDVGGQIESPRGPTSLRSEESMPDWDVLERPSEDMEKPEKYPGRDKKKKITEKIIGENPEDLDVY